MFAGKQLKLQITSFFSAPLLGRFGIGLLLGETYITFSHHPYFMELMVGKKQLKFQQSVRFHQHNY